MKPEDVTLPCSDGRALRASHFPAAGAARGTLVVAAALGVPRKIYAALARFLAARGYHVLTFDYRGIGDSRAGAPRGRDIRMQDWGRLDIEAALAFAHGLRAPRLFLLGHSAGGQLVGLAPSSAKLDGLVCVAATAPHPSLYPLKIRWLLALLWRVLVPLLSRGRDFFPSRRVGMGPIDVPAGVVREWAAWAGRPGYVFNPHWGVDTSRYPRLSMPLLNYAFDDDAYASPAAIEALLARYPAAPIERRVVRAAEHGALGHFGFFREAHRDTLWPALADWLDRAATIRSAA